MGKSDAERGWWQRNWGWCVGCGCLIPVLALGGIAFGTYWLGDRLFVSNDALRIAVQRLNEDSRAVEILGRPIEPKLWRENTAIRFHGEKELSARFGVEGPKGEGRLEIEAHWAGDDTRWQLDLLLLHLDDRDAPIDLLEEQPPEALEPADAA